MIQFTTEQLLEIALAVSAVTMFAIGLVFALVVKATGHRRAQGWTWGWIAAGAGLAISAAGIAFTNAQGALSLAGALTGSLAGVILARAAYRFAQNRTLPVYVLAVLAAGLFGALGAWILARYAAPLLGGEIGICVGVAANAAALFPLARDRRRGGARAACIVSILLAALMFRSILASIALGLQGEALTDVYWIIEVVAGTVLGWILALAEVVAVLDQLRLELMETNRSLERAMVGLETAAKIDSLTGLNNRYAFYTHAEEFSALGTRGAGCIAIVDLNNLKKINDTFGHHAGDEALLSVARRLKEVVRSSDHVFRWGGDEFVIVLRGTTVEKSRERLAHMPPPDPISTPKHPGPVELSVSWGVARLRKNIDAALREADARLYEQKSLVKNLSGELSSP